MSEQQPAPQHEWIASNVGDWDVDCTFFLDPSQPPMKVQATDRVVAIGPFFAVGHFEADMFGMPFKGLATLGFDPALGKFVSTWIGSVDAHLYYFTGDLDADGNCLRLSGRAPDPHSRTLTDWRTTENHRADGTRLFEMFVTIPGGPEIQMLRYEYRRK